MASIELPEVALIGLLVVTVTIADRVSGGFNTGLIVAVFVIDWIELAVTNVR